METSLLPQQKVGFRSQVYSEGAKLVLISDQAKDLVKNCFKGGLFILSFSKTLGYIGDLE